MNRQPSCIIGVLTPFTGGFYYGAILEGIQRGARARGATIVAIQTNGMDLRWLGEPDFLGLAAVDGWIAVNEFDSAPYLEEIARRKIPLVYVNAYHDGVPGCSVLPDNAGGTKSVVRHLIEHGHRRIAFAGSLHQIDLRERREGYCQALGEAGIEVDPSLLFTTSANLELDGHALGKKLATEGFSFSALVAGTDKLALGVLAELTAVGYRVPRDLALVGFDDIDKVQYADPPLTTVRQSFGLLAVTATHTLLDNLFEGTPLPQEIRVPTGVVLRNSCGCMKINSVRPYPSQGSLTERVDELTRTLLELAMPAGSTDPLSLWPGAARIATYLVAAFGERRDPLEDLNGAWHGFLQHNREAERMDKILFLLESSARAWSDDGRPGPTVLSALRDLRISLMRDWQRAEQRRIRSYELLGEANAKIHHALATSPAGSATDLSWLGWTQAHYGCLGLWEPPDKDEPRYLRIVSEFQAGSRQPVLGSARFAPVDFPPPSICKLIPELAPFSVLTIAPLRSSGENHGLLAVAAPIEIELLDHVSNIGDWANQVGAALDRAHIEQQLRHSALRDPLTQLPNRTHLLERLTELTGSSRRGSIAVVFLDLDDFKKINDGLGHQAGDELLVQLARRLEDVRGEGHLVARLGGDEFVVVVPDVESEEDAAESARRIQQAMQAPFQLNHDMVFTSCSIGVSFNDDPSLSAADLLRDADTAMYRAKVQGRARHEIFHRGMHAQAVERLKLDTRLRQALERGEFLLVYQPIVSAQRGSTVGAEALLRWNHPEQGLLTPGRFLAVAEDVGLAIPISQWVLTTACEQAVTWQRAGHRRYVSVNVPAEHLEQPDFVSFIEGLLKQFSLDPSALGIELVESTLIEHRETTTEALGALVELGVRVAIDDFGTGYSSLSYLRNFPVSVLKIDRSFVDKLPGNSKDAAITRAIITMGQGLGLGVVAEGVETQEQWDFLCAAGCEFVQGYLVGRPIVAEAWDRSTMVPYAVKAG